MPKGLAVPPAKPTTYERNFLRSVVCELRFPTLLELETQPPVAFQKALRTAYPLYEKARSMTFQAAGAIAQGVVYSLRSRNRRWVVSLRPSSLALTTEHYAGFDEFESRVNDVVKRTLKLLDTDFFTRVGLRYQNVLPTKQEEIEGWLNPVLAGPLTADVLGPVDMCWQDIRGMTDLGDLPGRYLLRHGVRADLGDLQYVLDMDFFAENVEAKGLLPILRQMREQCFSLFSWALGPKAREYLGPEH